MMVFIRNVYNGRVGDLAEGQPKCISTTPTHQGRIMTNMPGRSGVFAVWLPSVACHGNCEPSMRNPPQYRGQAEAAPRVQCQIRERENGELDGGGG